MSLKEWKKLFERHLYQNPKRVKEKVYSYHHKCYESSLVENVESNLSKTMTNNNSNSTQQTSETAQQKRFTFDKSFQEKIVQAMLIDRVWASQFSEVLEVDYFQFASLKLIANEYLRYHKQYKEFPTSDLLSQILVKNLKESGTDGILKDQVKEFFLTRIRQEKDLSDLPYVKDQALAFCKRAAMHKALLKSVELANSDKPEDQEKIYDEIKKALTAGNENTSGLDLFEDVDARYSETYRRVVPTGIRELDSRQILNGGLGAGELGFVVAASGVGKSHVLVHLGATALLQGKNVVHYTFELNERMMGIRYDSNLLDISSTDCYQHKDLIQKFYTKNADVMGKLRIKYFPTGTASVATLRAHLEKLSAQGFRPDVVVIDYAGIMRSTERYELLRLELKKICEELRQFGTELDVPVWTALQSNKEGANSDIIDITNLAEGFAQAHIADFIIGLSRPSKQKSTGYGTLFIAKNRAGMDGIQYKIHLDTARSKLRVLSEQEAAEMESDYVSAEEDEALSQIRRMKARQYASSQPLSATEKQSTFVNALLASENRMQ